MEQFNKLGLAYQKFLKGDPMRRLHWQTVLGKLENNQSTARKKLLDIGCGTGELDILAASESYNYSVTGFDPSENFIEIAEKEKEKIKPPLPISYFIARADQITDKTFGADERFDEAVSVMVMPYAPDSAYLQQFFGVAYRLLIEKGEFSSVIVNPGFTGFGKIIGNRIFEKNGDDITVNFRNPKTGITVFQSHLTQFSQAQYEEAAEAQGFTSFIWGDLHPTGEMVEEHGKEFWNAFEREQPYAMMSVVKK